MGNKNSANKAKVFASKGEKEKHNVAPEKVGPENLTHLNGPQFRSHFPRFR